jgi:hypothetical protein
MELLFSKEVLFDKFKIELSVLFIDLGEVELRRIKGEIKGFKF